MKYLFLLFHNGKAIHKEDFKLEKKPEDLQKFKINLKSKMKSFFWL